MQSDLQILQEKVGQGKRLNFDDGLRLFKSADVLSIGKLAQKIRVWIHGKKVYYFLNFHLNPTNICTVRCDFCAFSRDRKDPDAYALSLAEIGEKITEAVSKWGIREVHMVGGHNPDLGLDYYEELFGQISRDFPDICIKALSAPEIHYIAQRSGLSVEATLRRLKEAGLQSLPGGGAEIFESQIREQICPQKITGKEWLEIHRIAHRLGIPTNATMLYGHIENDEDRVNHLLQLRELQDETGGFQAFVPLAYQPAADSFSLKRETEFSTTGFMDLKMLSISRLLLDNIPHIKVHWPATDLKFAQTAVSFGADDIGGTNFGEQVMHEAGSEAPAELSPQDLVRLIEDAGYEPCLVNSYYQPIKESKKNVR